MKIQNIDFKLFKLFLPVWRIRGILLKQMRSFPELFLLKKGEKKTPFAYIDRRNKLVFEVRDENYSTDHGNGTSNVLRICVFETESANFNYTESPHGNIYCEDVFLYKDILMCSCELIEVYREHGINLKGWWTKKIPISIYSIVSKAQITSKYLTDKTKDELKKLIQKATEFNPEEQKEITDQEIIF